MELQWNFQHREHRICDCRRMFTKEYEGMARQKKENPQSTPKPWILWNLLFGPLSIGRLLSCIRNFSCVDHWHKLRSDGSIVVWKISRWRRGWYTRWACSTIWIRRKLRNTAKWQYIMNWFGWNQQGGAVTYRLMEVEHDCVVVRPQILRSRWTQTKIVTLPNKTSLPVPSPALEVKLRTKSCIHQRR